PDSPAANRNAAEHNPSQRCITTRTLRIFNRLVGAPQPSPSGRRGDLIAENDLRIHGSRGLSTPAGPCNEADPRAETAGSTRLRERAPRLQAHGESPRVAAFRCSKP